MINRSYSTELHTNPNSFYSDLADHCRLASQGKNNHPNEVQQIPIVGDQHGRVAPERTALVWIDATSPCVVIGGAAADLVAHTPAVVPPVGFAFRGTPPVVVAGGIVYFAAYR